jgi:glycosyltransferase involved in cell wall biosynthesis
MAYSCHDSFPSADTNTQQIFWTITEVVRLGVEVDLRIPSVTVDDVANPRAAIAAYYGAPAASMHDGFSIVPLGDHPPASWRDRGWFDWRAPRHLTTQSFDLIWTRDPLAAVTCVKAGLPVVFETYRPDFATRPRFGWWRRACLGSHLRGIVVHSRMAADAFTGAGWPEGRTLVAHNGFAPSLMEPQLDRVVARTSLGLPTRDRLVVYAGHTGRAKGIGALIALAAAVPAATFLLLGTDPSSPEARRIDRLAQRAGACNVRLVPRVKVADVAAYLYAADVLVIPPTDEPLRRYRRTVTPMKLFTYLAAGRPILAPRLPDIEEVLTDGQTARLVSPHNMNDAAAALKALLSDAALQDRLSCSARAAAAEYTWAERARRLVGFFERLSSDVSSGRTSLRDGGLRQLAPVPRQRHVRDDDAAGDEGGDQGAAAGQGDEEKDQGEDVAPE